MAADGRFSEHSIHLSLFCATSAVRQPDAAVSDMLVRFHGNKHKATALPWQPSGP